MSVCGGLAFRGQELVRSPGAEVPGGCEEAEMGARTDLGTPVRTVPALTTEPFLQPSSPIASIKVFLSQCPLSALVHMEMNFP